MKILVVLLWGCCLPCLLWAQTSLDRDHVIDTTGKKDLGDVFRSVFGLKPSSPAPPNTHSIYFSVFPSSSNQGGGRTFFTSTTAGFYTGNPETTYISSITFAPYFNLKSRYGLPLRSGIWLKDNDWYIMGDTRFMVYPQNTWGLGGNQPSSAKLLLDYKYIRVYQSVLKRITSYFFAGLGYNLDYHIDMETNDMSLRHFTHYPYGTAADQNSISSGVSVNLLYDTRNNDIDPMPGCYSNLVYRYNPTFMGSTSGWQSLYLDVRKYVSLTHSSHKNLLAFWTYYWTSLSGNVPYLDLPSIGWDAYQRSGRGIPQNRYRGNSLIYLETEYRRDITANGMFGFVVFSNINSVNEPNSRSFKFWHPAGGAGLRVKLNKNSNTNVGLDYAFSRDYATVNLNVGEAF